MSKSLDRITLLETFVRIADSGSISAAARDLKLSQPTVSRQLVDLEKRLNTQLVRRTTHSLALTDAGYDLLADARRLLDGWESLIEKHINAEEEIKGKLKVVAPIALGQTYLARLACQFQLAHPKVSLTWQLEDAPIRFAEVGCDCWIKVGSVPDENLVVKPLAKVERLLVAAPKMVKQDIYSHPDDLAGKPLLALKPFEGEHIPLVHTGGQHATFSSEASLTTNNIFSLKEAALIGLGFVVLPRWFVEADLRSGDLIDILPTWRAPTLSINAAYLPNRYQPGRFTAFLSLLKTKIIEIPGVTPP